MSLRAVELQVALPRAVDAAKIQEQLLQRGNVEQFDLAVIQRAERELDLTRTANVVGTKPLENPGEHAGKPARQARRGGNKKQEGRMSGEGVPHPHPYKGRHIDFTL